MKKAALIVISALLLFLFGVSISYRIALPEEKEKVVEKYFIYTVDENTKREYTLKLDDEKNYNLTVNEKNEYNVGTVQSNYDLALNKEDYAIVKKVIDYFEKTYDVNGKNEYKFYFDYEDFEEKVFPDDKKILVKMSQAIENIAKGNELLESKTYREIGEKMLREVEEEL